MEKNTPFGLGYAMPAEWREHDGTWLAWPKNEESFPEEIRPEVEKTYVEIINTLAPNETVNLLVDDKRTCDRVRSMLDSRGVKGKVAIHTIRTVDVWFRDYGPIFVVNKSGEVAYDHWGFNAWGEKYEDLKEDAHIPDKIPLHALRSFSPRMVLEGGSIDVNGEGTLLTTEHCLLNKNRNPNMTRSKIEGKLADYLGATKVIWLKDGIAGDDTDGHIDDIARFVNEDTVVCALEEDKKDENYSALRENFELLEKSTDAGGNSLRVVPLPMPRPVVYKGQRLPASYTNFYIANGVVLVPTFRDPSDEKALGILGRLFPGRKIIGINCRELAYGFGTIHCATQQQPKGNINGAK